MAQPPPPTGSAAARSALAQKLSGVPPDYFVIKLYQMLQEQREVLTWDPDGGIIIHDRQRLEATLSVYFRHNRFTSFQRQLNNFGFHKKRKPTACLSGTAAQQRKGAAYDHPLLVGQQPEAVRDRRLFYGGGVAAMASRRPRRPGGTVTGKQRRSSASAATRARASRAARPLLGDRRRASARPARRPSARARSTCSRTSPRRSSGEKTQEESSRPTRNY